ncbi:DENN domain-containing protein 1B isoform X3 [Rhinichthys klamathensis goyatoka]|uniref:DENN domain-containing protein 1B isoform X3 n=1 Tax=Rhinichthys klamathensis goyatoka TaxID=3034132 RepID=UPI0024B51731|nr:DENN domain-containing protein 1B isoform X3 [Rhinichthys klamathensis goyatoka]
MGSRIKENPDKTFYWCFQASCPIARDKDPGVLFQFPEDFNDEESLQSLPRFCFPYDIERAKDTVAVQHFAFVLTDLEGCQRFGFCRLTSSSQTCFCILSHLPWFEVFYKLLNNLADYSTKGQTNEMKELLSVLYKQPVPPANGSITLQMIPYFIAPDPKALPSIPESRNLTELVVAVDVGNLLQLYASMLFERRILIYCSKLSTLTACVHACNGMLFPMYWQHIFIPVLPPHLLDYCCAPMPYLIGIHSSLAERVKSRALEDVVILNVDTNTLESPHEDLKKIPADVVAGLKVRLKRQAASAGSGVAHAFLRAQALLFGGYRDALQSPAEGPVVFCNESFLSHKSQSMREFLESAVHLQCFKEFIDGRLEMLNQGKEPEDAFEEEVLQCGASSGASKLRRQWVGNLKKGGGALIVTWKSTANKASKYQSKFGLKNLLSSKDQTESHMLQRGGSVCGTHTYRLIQSDCLQNRLPITQHFGRSRPRRPARKHPSKQDTEEQTEDDDTYEDSVTESAEQCSGTSDLQDEDELSLLADPEEMDLLGEIFDTLSAQSSREPGLLYGTRSLDLFSSDSSDFIRHKSCTTPSQESLSQSFGNSGSLMSWEEEEPGGKREESDAMIDRPENELNVLEKDLNVLGESLCSDLQSLEDTSLVPEVVSQEVQEDQCLQKDGQMNGTMEESLDTETIVEEKTETMEESLDTETIVEEKTETMEESLDTETIVEEKTKTMEESLHTETIVEGRTETQPDKEEEHQKEHKTTNDLGSNGPANGGIPSAVVLNVEIDKEEEPEEKSVEPSSPKVSSTVALLRSRSLTDSSASQGREISMKTPIRTFKINVGSKTGVQTEEQSTKSPVTSTPEEQDPAPIKVSELKKRFEH